MVALGKKEGNIRLSSLDVVRGLASLAIVVQHWWQHFGTIPGAPQNESVDRLPFSSFLSPLYHAGSTAVTMFFCLSGFVFYWLYSKGIAERREGLLNFAGLRFSRLYPLHFAMLIIVAILQLIYTAVMGSSFVVQYNDAYHFFLNLFLVQFWGFQKGYSFDGPSWSISIEVALYLIFFATCYVRLHRVYHLLILLLIAWGIARYNLIPSAFVAFLAGGITYLLFSKLECSKKHLTTWLVVFAAIAVWCIAPQFTGEDVLANRLREFLNAKKISLPSWVMLMVKYFGQRMWELLIFPITILALALAERRYSISFKRLEWLGNISYSTYLIHFPLQLVFVLFSHWTGRSSEWFLRCDVFIAFFLVLIPLSLASYYGFERPTQSFLRNRFFRKSK